VRESESESTARLPASATPEAALARGTALGRFVVLGLVGRGAMGEVYGAYDPDLDRKIAIKLVRSRGSADTAEGRTRLMREAQATAKISHPNVVVVYDAGTFQDRVFIAMEFVEGHTLRYWLQERERAWPELLDAFVAAGRGLAAAHEKELVHRDFKPDNVMVAKDGHVRVMDFGLARIAADDLDLDAADAGGAAPDLTAAPFFDPDATALLTGPTAGDAALTLAFQDKITATGALLGTPAYMSPEQFQGRTADARSDQFSFCVALYEAACGERPFAGRSLDELARNVARGVLSEPPSSRRVPRWLRKVLERGLRVDPAERFPTMQALLGEIEKGIGRGGFAAQAAAKLAGVWAPPEHGEPVSTPEKEAIRSAFLATGKAYAAASFESVSATLDRYTQRWSEIYVEVCEATHVRGEQSAEILDLRMALLTESLDDLKALCRLFREATPEAVTNADKAASALGSLDRCQDVALVRNLLRLPEDFEKRAAVAELRGRLVEVRALSRVGHASGALEMLGPLLAEARRVDYGPLLAEALLLKGNLEEQTSRIEQARLSLEEAFSAAELVRHDEVAAEAALTLVAVDGMYLHRFDVAELWGRFAETILRRMGSHDLLWGWYFNNRSGMRQAQGRLAEAVEDAGRSIEAKTRALGPHSFDVGITLGNVANVLALSGNLSGALEANERALSILEAASPEHPRTAVTHANHGQCLYRLGRFEEGERAVRRALAIFERETDPRGVWVTYPLRTLGLCQLATGRVEEARAALERCVEIREAIEKNPMRLAEVHYPLARALDAMGDRARALALGQRARREYEEAPPTPLSQKDLAELDLWLAARAKPPAPRRFSPAPRAKKRGPGSPPRPRRASRVGRRPSSPR
jgi:serine/threonine protein kinase/tetratricopeptide (TPR) repeat protein